MLAPDAVHPVLEPLAQTERVRDHGLVVPRQPKLGGGRVHHLLGWRDTGGGDKDQERDAIRHRGRERRDPTSLAEPPEPDSLGVDRVAYRKRIGGLHHEAPAGGVSRRLALAATIEGGDADAGRR